LASASPRRRQLLSGIGLDFEVLPADIDEEAVSNAAFLAGFSSVGVVEAVAQAKAKVIAEKFPTRIILAADTIVVLKNEVQNDDGEKAKEVILGKPTSIDHAISMLLAMQNRKHIVHTAVSIYRGTPELNRSFVCSTEVTFKPLSIEEIKNYVATGEPMDKAGSYGVQEKGGFLVKSINGSYTNVVGLPLAETLEVLQELKVWEPEFLSSVPD
jgi:septum formation protein